MSQPLLSIGMIFKNEMRCLERCMKALAPLRAAIPCELVMADTGSTDGSREIAERYADILFDFPWVNDFSAARNAVMDRCSGVWYLTLDADEDLDGDFSELAEFLVSPAAAEYGSCQVVQRNYVFPDNTEVYNDFYALRMARMDTGARYAGAIHETFADGRFATKRLPRVILHHDGYVSAGGIMQSKSERNMPLLEKELKGAPYSIGRVVQCIESARDGAERKKYVRRGLRVIQQGKSKTPDWDPIVYRYAVEIFRGDDLDYGLELLAEGKEKYPNSLFMLIDGEGFALEGCYQMRRCQEAMEHGALWRAAAEKLDAGELDTGELGLSILHCANAASRSLMECMLFDCGGQLGEWEAAGETLGRVAPEYLNEAQWIAVTRAVFQYSEHLDNLTPQLSRFWAAACRYAEEQKEGWAGNRAYLLSALNVQFTPVEGAQPGIQNYIAQMEDCEPGRSARIILSWDDGEVRQTLEEIQNWDEVLFALYPHVMAMGLDFPDAFYRRGAEFLAETAARIPQYDPAFTRTVLERSESAELRKNPVKLTWAFDTVIAALRTEQWREREQCGALCARFRELAGEYLGQLYNRERLNVQDIPALPGMHRFSWYCLQAREALEAGDEAACARMLKAALEAAPIMKSTVKFLMDEAERAGQRKAVTAAPPELLTLAEQVKGLLAACPPDDPAVQALKQSEVYQKVAFLIEEPAARWKM